MKPVGRGEVTVGRPLAELEEEFDGALGEHDESTTMERGEEPGQYRAVSVAGRVRIVQEYAIAELSPEATQLSAVVWLEPALAGWVVRRVLGRRRLQRRIDAALTAMARRASGLPAEDEWEPDEADWLDEEDEEASGTGAAGGTPQPR